MATPMTSAELDRWFHLPNDLGVWEDIASWFQAETGHLRPGKDKPFGFHPTQDGEPDCCHEAWLEWTRDKQSCAVAGLLSERRFLRSLIAEAVRDFHGKSVLFSTPFLNAAKR